MAGSLRGSGLRLFSTCPPSSTATRETYFAEVVNVARWSEAAGCEGILVYTDNGLVDPWLVSQAIVSHTERLCPLVAVQPVYMHPYSVARMVASFGFLYGRRVYLNMVAGGFTNDLKSLHDPTPHDERYARLVEYTTLIMDLLRTSGPVTLAGRYYSVTNIKMSPPLPEHLLPGVFISGSSTAGIEAARRLRATAVQYPRPAAQYAEGTRGEGTESGIRVGIIARADPDRAWRLARERFPQDRKGQLTHQLAMRVSDSVWHKQLSELSHIASAEESPYWTVPFENYKTFCPYLVGSYERVADEVVSYLSLGYRTFILDVPPSPEELAHIRIVFERAAARVTS